MRKFFALLLASVLLIAGCGTQTPEEGIKETLTNWIDAVCKKDFEKANSYLTPDAQNIFNMAGFPFGLFSLHDKIHIACKNSDKQDVNIFYVRSLDASGTLYEANFKINFSNGKSYSDVYKFIKTNHGWKIHVLRN